ncbi:type III pantothenate kinase [Gilvimarinus sp. F26214L]|uniref:type III pantothenate kinase n=1 Tax=Gilvimarinus sp. DZF01 TaxID=3461371 RepID=UPI0040457C87
MAAKRACADHPHLECVLMDPVILDLDMGNTRLKWRYRTPARILSEGAVGYAQSALEELPNPPRDLQRIRIATVVRGEALERLLQACRERWRIEPELARVQDRCAGLTQGYEDKSRLGVDRWLATLAAHEATRSACVVVSCGTAVTADLVTAGGVHLGGYIVPGLGLMRAALFDGTHAVKVEEVAAPTSLAPGTDTDAAVSRGLLLMLQGLVEKAVLELRDRGELPLVVVTGGDAEKLLPFLSGPHRSTEVLCRPNLVLDGLPLALP